MVFGQWAEATDGGRRPSGIVEPEPERVVVTPGAAGMRLVPDREAGTGVEVLTPEYRRIMEIVVKASGPVMAKDVALALGPETPQQRSSRSAASCASCPTGAGCPGTAPDAICRADHNNVGQSGRFQP
ncbi:hypothetical protein QF037_009512 [Streptomyces canus]|uniref:hypothetical protein n=1 Tax=Streptomyces canus TaxID=58343 RepID=UPI002786D1BF|nr:hypothetical protein [Streptomyces canus]MDQ0605167.1 hypothetical protein [Streptomyces canus]